MYLLDRVGGIVTVTLDQPARLNALSRALLVDLEALWGRLAGDPTVRCVVLTGAGRGFCAGADVTELAAPRQARGSSVDEELAFLPGRRLEVPVVVAVNGVCAGGGLHFVADADIVVAGESARFVDPHVSVGQVSGIEPASLALRVPLGVLSRLALLGRDEELDAAQALVCGLVSEVVPDDRLAARAADLAGSLASASPTALRATRRVLRELEQSLVEPAMARGWAAVQAHWSHPDAGEGPRAFVERRLPVWAEVQGEPAAEGGADADRS